MDSIDKHILKCFSPRLISNPATIQEYYVSCGHCPACLTRKAYSLKYRVENECSYHAFSLFFTLTYDNNHIPFFSYDSSQKVLCSDCEYSKDVVFDDIPYDEVPKYLQNDNDSSRVGVLSKYDIQKFLKRVRITIQRKLNIDVSKKLRYFICGEYGPCTLRPHYHGIFWTDDKEIADFLPRCISQAWKMCPSFRTFNECSFVSSNAPQYVSAYVNSVSDLPSYLQRKQTKPFHLASKNPAVGYYHAPEKEIFKAVTTGSFTLSRYDSKSGLLCYDEISPYDSYRFFPKCRSFNKFNIVQRIKVYSSDFERARKRILEHIRESVGFKSCSLEFARRIIAPFRKYGLSLSDLMLNTHHITAAASYVCDKMNISLADYVDFVDRLYLHRSLTMLKSQLQYCGDLIKSGMTNLVRYLYPLNFIPDSISYLGMKDYHFTGFSMLSRYYKAVRNSMAESLYCLSDLRKCNYCPERSPNFVFAWSDEGRQFVNHTLSQIQNLSKFKRANEFIQGNEYMSTKIC